jgi:hypothetical protein
VGGRKAVILIWLSGGPSHLDTWDPKPDAPAEVRGPFRSVATGVPGVRVCEHLPRQAAILDRLALGQFGRSPVFSQRGTGGREHWSNCMSMLVAGGWLAGGQVIGRTEAKGG